MAYGFNEQTSTAAGGQYIDEAGIYDAKLASVAYENAKNDGSGKNILAFRFETQDGKSFRHIEWDIDEARITQTATETFAKQQASRQLKADKSGKLPTQMEYVKQWIAGEYESQGKRIKHIAEAYGGGQGAIQATSYQDFATKVAASFKSLDTSAYKPLLIVYNQKDYATLPKYTPFFGVDRKVFEAKIQAKPKSYRMEKLERDSDSSGATPDDTDDQF